MVCGLDFASPYSHTNMTNKFHLVRTSLLVSLWLLTCCAANAQSKSPDDGGAVFKGVYTNDYFHFSFRYPRDWSVHGTDANQMIRDIAREKSKRTGALGDSTEAILKQTYQLLTVFRYPVGTPDIDYNPAVIIIAENISHAPGIITGRDYWRNTLPVLVKLGAQVKSDEPTVVLYGGREFYRLDYATEVNGKVIHQSSFVNVDHRFALAFGFLSADEQQLEQMIKAMDSLTFSPLSTRRRKTRRGQ